MGAIFYRNVFAAVCPVSLLLGMAGFMHYAVGAVTAAGGFALLVLTNQTAENQSDYRY